MPSSERMPYPPVEADTAPQVSAPIKTLVGPDNLSANKM
jgi:hypothetical protein